MLVQFTVGNFRSFSHPQTLSLEATAITEYKENVFKSGKAKLLTAVAIYGANSSGKSNFLQAMGAMKDFVSHNLSKSSTEEIQYDPFLLIQGLETEPSLFEIVFVLDEIQYRYGFEIDDTKVQGEWLFETKKNKEIPLFIRVADGIEVYKNFEEGINLESKTRDNALFLSVVDQFNGFTSNKIMTWFHNFNVIDGTKHNNYRGITFAMLDDEIQNKKLNAFYSELDLGFSQIEIVKEPFNSDKLATNLPEDILKRLITDLEGKVMTSMFSTHELYDADNIPTGKHRKFNVRFQESSGTNKIIDLSGPIFDTLSEGGVLAIDELDAKLHPILTIAIIKLFQNENFNPKHAQLIFATHNTTILSKGRLRRDQVYFTEKNKSGSTDLYSLVEYNMKGKRVRKDNSFEKDYLNRKYGAVPEIGQLNSLEWLEK